MTRLPLLSLLALLACAPSSASTDTAADEQAIRGKIDGWNQALSSQNDSAIGLLYADDAVLMPPNMPRITGRKQIRALFADIWPMKATLILATVQIRVSGDWAVEDGSTTFTMPGPHGDITDRGKYLISWHRIDGDWKVEQDIWNSDAPPPGPVSK